MKNTLIFTLLLTALQMQAQTIITDTTFITPTAQGLYLTHLTIDDQGKRTQTDVPITDTVQQVQALRQLSSQEIGRRVADMRVVQKYRAEIGGMIRDGNQIEQAYGVILFDTTGQKELTLQTWALKGYTQQTTIFFRVVKVQGLDRLQWSFTKATGTWKRAYYSPGYLRLTEWNSEGFIEYFQNGNNWYSLGTDYVIRPATVVKR
ncbi:MAG: hypothetical protein ACK5XN_19105 [Bacteroidota bacterium]